MGSPSGGVYGTSGVSMHCAHFSRCSHLTAYTPPGASGRMDGMSLYLPSSGVGVAAIASSTVNVYPKGWIRVRAPEFRDTREDARAHECDGRCAVLIFPW